MLPMRAAAPASLVVLATGAHGLQKESAMAVQVAKARYITLLRLDAQFGECVELHGVQPGPQRFVPHQRALAQLRARAKRSAAAEDFAGVDRHSRSVIKAVDTSCIVGPTQKTSTAVDAYDKDLQRAEQALSVALARVRRAN